MYIYFGSMVEFRAQSVHGKDETPFLLKRITELTKGQSLAASMYPITWKSLYMCLLLLLFKKTSLWSRTMLKSVLELLSNYPSLNQHEHVLYIRIVVNNNNNATPT